MHSTTTNTTPLHATTCVSWTRVNHVTLLLATQIQNTNAVNSPNTTESINQSTALANDLAPLVLEWHTRESTTQTDTAAAIQIPRE
jgi:hypothetical protein